MPSDEADTTEVGTPPWREAVAALSLGVAAVFFCLAPAQFGAEAAYGFGLVAAAWLSVAVAVTLVVQRSRVAALAVLVLHGALVAAWIFVHTVGAPFGPSSGTASEPGVADTIAMALGMLAVLCTLAMLVGLREWFARPVVGGAALGAAATMALLGSIVGIAEYAREDDNGHAHGTEGVSADHHSGEMQAEHEHGEGTPAVHDHGE
jgi:hypothetical protein